MSKLLMNDYINLHMWYSEKQSRQTNTLALKNKDNKTYIITSFSISSNYKPIYNDTIYIGYDNVKYNHVHNTSKLSRPY